MLDPCTGHGADQPVVPRHLPAARSLLSAAPAGLEPAGAQRRTAERNEEQVATWVKDTWPLAGPTTARDQDAWICFADKTGQSLRPPKART